MKDLSITTIQADLHWEDKEQNLKMFEKYIESIQESTDLIILPEMFSTGFSMRAEELAENMNETTVQWMKNIAIRKNAAITGSIIIKDGSHYYNRLIWTEPNGLVMHYDKRHLFGMGDENKHYSSGQSKLIVDYKGWKINLNICYDLRFPVWLRNSKVDPYDLLVFVANWPEKRIEHWDALLRARAIENQCYVVGVNRTGMDGNSIHHTGNTSVIHPFGNILYSSSDAEHNTILLSKHELELNRRQFPFLRDAD